MLTTEPINLESIGVKISLNIYHNVSLLCPYGVWVGQPKQFQYDMTVDAQIYTKQQAKKEFLKMALEYYNNSDIAKKEYMSWLLKIR